MTGAHRPQRRGAPMREPSERLEEEHATNPPFCHANYQYFLHRQDTGWSRSRISVPRWSCELQAHYSLSWFKPLPGGNSPTSSSLILKMNSGYNGVSRELEKFTK
jgi:hypothetical protein